jgi:hypothetical protein
MKSKLKAFIPMALALALAAAAGSTSAQNASANASDSSRAAKTDRSIEYHGGQVLGGIRNTYYVFYGCWGMPNCANLLDRYNDAATMQILLDFGATIGNTPYMQINSTYTDAWGNSATPTLIWAGMVVDQSYSHGQELTEAGIQAIIADQIDNFRLPHDPDGIYIVLTTSDVTVIDGATQFCLTCCNLHGHANISGGLTRYIFVGNPSRCPGNCGANPNVTETPNGNYAADQMVSWLAHAFNQILTNPHDDGWYDRNGLENSEKCEGTYGTTFTVTNPNGHSAQANFQPGQRAYLLQQNWVNGKKGHCGLNP